MLFNLTHDPHEQVDLSARRPELVAQAMQHLSDWQVEMAQTGSSDVDPLVTVLREGGAHHTRGSLPAYLERLRTTGRAHHAQTLAARHPSEI